MKRLPVLVSFVLFIALCASIAYWGLQLFKPSVRPMAAPPAPPMAEPRLDLAASLFGGRKTAVAVASNYALKGVVVARNPNESVALLATDGKPAQALGIGQEVVRGVTVQEVHSGYVLLSEGGALKRVPLPENVPPQVSGLANRTPVPGTLPTPQFPGAGMGNQPLPQGIVPPHPGIQMPGFTPPPN